LAVIAGKEKPSILGVTPARGGSKGIPKKNIKMMYGKPLIAWTIEAAKEARLLDSYVVSTESPEIANVSRRFGADVLERPQELSGDDVGILRVVQHALEVMPSDLVVLLECTSPIRSAGLIDACIGKFLDQGVDALGTVFEDYSYEYGRVMPRRQEILPRLVDVGSVYVIRSELAIQGKLFNDSRTTYPLTREESVEIDDSFDFWLAERILQERWCQRYRGDAGI
jgi:CMP-N-acetylneuraminic acid synthetase